MMIDVIIGGYHKPVAVVVVMVMFEGKMMCKTNWSFLENGSLTYSLQIFSGNDDNTNILLIIETSD